MIGKRINYDYSDRDHTQDDLRFAEDIIVREGRIEQAPQSIPITNLRLNGFTFDKVIGSLDIGNNVLLFCRYNRADGNPSFKLIYYFRENEILKEIVLPNNINLAFGNNVEISSTYRINEENNIEVVFTDGINKPYFINIGNDENIANIKIDTEVINDTNDILLFPEERTNVVLDINTDNQGSLQEGVYFITYRYFYKDGKRSSFNGFSHPIVVNDGDRIIININQDVKSPYDGIELYVLFNNEVRRFYQRELTNFNMNFTQIYSNNNVGTVITLNELTIPSSVYNRVESIGEVDNRLILGGLTTNTYDVNNRLQSLVNNVRIEVTRSKITDFTTNNRTFRPGEVYALYLQPQYISGEFGKAYHIPARTDNSSNSQATKVFEEDIDYPLGGDFPVGKVKNHRIPDEIELYNNVLSADQSTYMQNNAFVLGLRAIIPNNLGTEVSDNTINSIKRWRLLYAKKTLNNSRIIDHGQLTFSGEAIVQEVSVSDNSNVGSARNLGVASVGGINQYRGTSEIYRFTNDSFSTPSKRFKNSFKLTNNKIRLQSPEILLNRYRLPEGSLQLKMGLYSYVPKANGLKHYDDQEPISDSSITDNDNITTLPPQRRSTFIDYKFIDYTTNGKLAVGTPSDTTVVNNHRTKSLTDFEYALSGVTGIVNNIVGETCLVGTANSVLSTDHKWVDNENFTYRIDDTNGLTQNNSSIDTINEKVLSSTTITTRNQPDLMVNGWLINNSGNYHGYFWREELIPIDTVETSDNILESRIGKDGDTFIAPYTGFYSAPYSSKFLGNEGRINITTDGQSGYLLNCGIKAFRKTLLYSRLNMNSRRSTVPESKFEDFSTSGELYQFMKLRDTRNSQQIIVNAELSRLNTFESITVHYDNVFDIELSDFPNRLHASLENQWRHFPPLQIQDIGAGLGKVQKISTWGDRTFIHQENGLHITRDKVSIQTDETAAYVGTTNFLGVQPQRVLPSTIDVGLRDKSKAILTKLGYAFIGATNKVYLLSEKLEEISSYATRYLFRDGFPLDYELSIGYNEKEERIMVNVLTNENVVPNKTIVLPNDIDQLSALQSSFKLGDIILFVNSSHFSQFNNKIFKIVAL